MDITLSYQVALKTQTGPFRWLWAKQPLGPYDSPETASVGWTDARNVAESNQHSEKTDDTNGPTSSSYPPCQTVLTSVKGRHHTNAGSFRVVQSLRGRSTLLSSKPILGPSTTLTSTS